MLPYRTRGDSRVTLVMMPFLGGSQLEWSECIELLSSRFRCITTDLPGFGDAANIPGPSVEEMVHSVAVLLQHLALENYLLVGHSMAGKVAMAVTRLALAGNASFPPPVGLVLVAPSPPGPEPMTADKRQQMLHSLGSLHTPDEDVASAKQFINDNTASPLPPHVLDRTAGEVLRMNRAAWTAWLEGGSKEDWSTRIGVLEIPALILAGEHDKALGPDAQLRLTAPHLSNLQLIEMNCSHLIPLEEPDALAEHISLFVDSIKAS